MLPGPCWSLSSSLRPRTLSSHQQTDPLMRPFCSPDTPSNYCHWILHHCSLSSSQIFPTSCVICISIEHLFSCLSTHGCVIGVCLRPISFPLSLYLAWMHRSPIWYRLSTTSLCARCCHKWLTFSCRTIIVKISILKGKFEINSLRTSYLFLKRWPTVNVQNFRCTLM